MKRVLHWVRRGPSSLSLQRCLNRAAGEDAIVLIEEAVVAVAGRPYPWQRRVYVLTPDLIMRGHALSPLPPSVVPVDYAGLVDLVCQYELSRTWP